VIRKLTGIQTEDAYNHWVAEREHAPNILILMSAVIMINILIYKKKLLKALREFWINNQFDMVISVMPFINSIISNSMRTSIPKTPFVTVVTDYSECAKYIWINGKDQFLICGTDKLVSQAQQRLDSSHIFKLSGMITNPSFYNTKNLNKNKRILELGFQVEIPIGLVMFGSHGSSYMVTIAQKLQNIRGPIQMIFICGHNDKLKLQLEAMHLNYSVYIVGLVDDVQNYMAIADFFIGKPGGASITEAAIMHLPMIILCGPKTLLQEKYNARWVQENEIGICINNLNQINYDVENVLNSIPKFRENYKKINNTGIFEIPEILQKIWDA
jgi:UDP-N-acetylglucosamine:LPS N-acetylglucosamine transferase